MSTALGNVFGSPQKAGPIPNQFKNEIAQEKGNPNAVVMNELASLIKNDPAEKYIKFEENERGITIHIMDKLLFNSGNADLNKNSVEILDKLANVLRKLPNDIRVEGHTDNVPINSNVFQSNWHLSVARALNTAYFLIQNKNLSADKVSIVGYSEYKPIASNLTAEGRALNRRVDIVILKK
jgi:chemotaxis protein MotB